MLTTVTPGAQELSMASSAATPPKEAPYPTLVGTATRGTPVRPPTTLGSAPSMPATTTRQSAPANRSRASSSRCRPATPTSSIRVTPAPWTAAVSAASAATGASEVPALITATRPRPVRVPLVQGAQDPDDLLGGLALAVDHLGIAGAGRPVDVDARVAEVGRACVRVFVRVRGHRTKLSGGHSGSLPESEPSLYGVVTPSYIKWVTIPCAAWLRLWQWSIQIPGLFATKATSKDSPFLTSRESNHH